MAATTSHPAPPSEDVFGLNEVSEALRLMGASPKVDKLSPVFQGFFVSERTLPAR